MQVRNVRNVRNVCSFCMLSEEENRDFFFVSVSVTITVSFSDKAFEIFPGVVRLLKSRG